MQLYYAPRTISVAVAIALEEAGLEYEAIKVDFATSEQTSTAYKQINPKGRVPALVVEGGILTEAGALMEYISAKAPEAGLTPDDPLLAARMREMMFYLASTMHVNHAHRIRGERWADNESSWKDMEAKAPETMTASCEYVVSNGLRGPFVMGERFSLADAYLYAICLWLENDGVDVSAFPKILAFRQAMEERASVQAVKAAGMI